MRRLMMDEEIQVRCRYLDHEAQLTCCARIQQLRTFRYAVRTSSIPLTNLKKSAKLIMSDKGICSLCPNGLNRVLSFDIFGGGCHQSHMAPLG